MTGVDLLESAYVGDSMVEKIVGNVYEQIMVMETVKKIPDYNTNMTVELAFQCAWMKSLMPDPKEDDGVLLEEDDEPKSTIADNCMSENIDVQP